MISLDTPLPFDSPISPDAPSIDWPNADPLASTGRLEGWPVERLVYVIPSNG